MTRRFPGGDPFIVEGLPPSLDGQWLGENGRKVTCRMFKLFLRDALVAALLLALVAGAAALLGLPAIARGAPAPWSPELARIDADPTLLARDAALLLFALAALGGVARTLTSGFRLLGRDYPAAAHLAEALASRLVRRAGALAGVSLTLLQGSVARAAGPFRHDTVAPMPRAALVHPPAASLRPTPATPPSKAARWRIMPPRARRAVRRVGLAVRYTVQPDDTMDDVAARFGLPDWRPIMAATRGVPQPIGGPIVDPNVIVPGQILLIPLPCPALRLVGDRALYVVQQGDYLSEIAARFLGDWRLYPQIGDLNRGVHQPDGTALEDDNLIQPGWVLRLPREYVVARPDGSTVTRRVVVDDMRPIRLRRNLRPRRRVSRPIHLVGPNWAPVPVRDESRARREGHAAITGRHYDYETQARLYHLPRRRPHSARPVMGQTREQPRRHRQDRRSRSPHAPRPIVPRMVAGQSGRPGRRRLVPRREAPLYRRPAGSRPWPIAAPTVQHPVVHVPDLGRDLPLAFVVGFLAVAAIATRRRRTQRQGKGGGAGTPQPWANRLAGLAPSVRRALHAALDGVDGRLARALCRTPASTTGTARAAYVVAALEQVGREAAVPYSLAGATRLVLEGAETLDLVVAAPRLTAAQVDDVARCLGAALGVTVAASRAVERDGTPVVTLTVAGGKLAAPVAVRPHPAPLLVPLGATADGVVVHLHLGHTGGLLVAGNGQSLVATLLASTVYQAPPDALRLLIASDDDELRKALPQLDHLEAPPADARDPRAVATIIAQAHTLVLDRYERHAAPTIIAPGRAAAGAPVPCLLVLTGIEDLDDEALDRLDAVAHTGPVCGVHLIASVRDPAALASSGMLALFRTRVAKRLAPADNALVCPDADTGTLGPQEILFYGSDHHRRLHAFTLAPPEVREVFATVVASALPALPPVGSTPAPAPPPPPSVPQEQDVTEATAEQRETDMLPIPAGGADDVSGPSPEGGEMAPAEEGEDESVAVAGADATAAASEGANVPPVRVDLLGGTAIYVHGQPLPIYPRERNILAALAVMGPRPVRRDDLIEAIFADDADGGNTLSHALSELRTVLRNGGLPREQAKNLVQRSSSGYFLHPDLVAVDLWRFDALLRDAEGRDEADAGPVLAEAFALYHGSLCAGDALDFLEERGYRWMQRVPTALYTLADYYREHGDLKTALHWARRLLIDDPCDDHANQLVLNLLAEMGDAGALDAHAEAMRAQYAINKQKPDPYTLRLCEQLRRKLGGGTESKAG